ncbi:MAG: HAD family hydrolase [Betaproteobacteria bacterium]|jgi:HAD superfamily hydrolase (TIGR01490 family)|nr:HAD-IB family hydrolase [Pseudomonadota bacterium]NBO04784.1 HAD family hydrolase [Betaproteobacteria bacterium]NBO96665.1 HAD family hydrolase [Betaproteobacteria bacterium]NBP35659.1 HAD family hydrolase [Betaproteobacteria bacterium]NBP38290.1 HAD family hydrolase [Betaproteobacteria bacterium]
MQLALFDLDHTLIPSDSDHAWGQFLVRRGEVDPAQYAAENDRFYQQYCEGTLDIELYLRFALAPLARIEPGRLLALQGAFMQEVIEPLIRPQALALVGKHKAAGDVCLLITATNEFVTAPIAKRFGIEHLIACGVEQIEGRYTGQPQGIPSFREGKVTRLSQWIQARGHEVEALISRASFYSDSANDIALLERVGHPVATNPDSRLRAHAKAKGWPCLELFSEDDALKHLTLKSTGSNASDPHETLRRQKSQ